MLSLTPRHTGDLPEGLKPLANTNPTLARIYAGRNITDIEALETALNGLLAADGLLGIDKAVTILNEALNTGKRILIVGDFDCDGATSTALMVKALSEMGADTGATVDFIVPDRFKYGYGLTPEIVEIGIDKFNPDLVVTVDNGISSHEGVAKAHAHGIKVIITDHHLTTKPTPPAEAVVNPNQLNCNFASKSLVGVGVAFYVLGRLAKYRREQGRKSYQVTKHLDIVALGTVADVGILDKNNRILVQHGLNAIKAGNGCVGIQALLEQAGRDRHKITAQDFGFVIAPRINAAGRMDNMKVGIECLLTKDWGVAQRLAHQLDTLNKERRSVEGKIKDQAEAIMAGLNSASDQAIQSKSLVLYQDDWHQGVIGIVAGRLKESHYKPAIVFAPADTDKVADADTIKGSARSIAGIHIRDAIEQVAEANPELISHFGGHAMAAGLTLKKANFDAFKKAFEEVMSKVDANVFTEQKLTDGQLTGADFSLQFVSELKEANIWGHGFEPPIFDGMFEVVNTRVLKDKHLKLSLKYPNVQYPIDAIWFNYNNQVWDYRASQVHVLFELDINEWNGNQNLQLMVRDLSVENITP